MAYPKDLQVKHNAASMVEQSNRRIVEGHNGRTRRIVDWSNGKIVEPSNCQMVHWSDYRIVELHNGIASSSIRMVQWYVQWSNRRMVEWQMVESSNDYP